MIRIMTVMVSAKKEHVGHLLSLTSLFYSGYLPSTKASLLSSNLTSVLSSLATFPL